MNDKELSILKDIAYDCPVTLSVSNARSVLEYYYGEYFKECEESDTRINRFIDPESFNKQPVSNAYISENYPDPFSEITSIDYFIPEGSTGTIFINDIYGRRICRCNSYEGNTHTINTSDFRCALVFMDFLIITITPGETDIKKKVSLHFGTPSFNCKP